MIPGLPLFDAATRARRRDPETSRLAASRAPGLASKHQGMILNWLRTRPGESFTYEQIAEGLSLEKHKVGRRLKELSEANLILETGAAELSSGRMGRTWRATA